MANIQQSLDDILTIDGSMCCALVDANSGMMLGQAGSGVDLEVAAAGNTEVVRAKLKTMSLLKLKDNIEDMLITLGKQYHIIRPIAAKPGLFLYIVLDKARSNLALALRLRSASPAPVSPPSALSKGGGGDSGFAGSAPCRLPRNAAPIPRLTAPMLS